MLTSSQISDTLEFENETLWNKLYTNEKRCQESGYSIHIELSPRYRV